MGEPVAETFTFVDEAGISLGHVAALDTLVTVTDASVLLDELGSAELLAGRGWQAAEGDARSVAGLLCEQLEFCNVIVLNKCTLGRLRALLRVLNPHARVLETTRGAVRVSDVLGTGAFSLGAAEAHPAWLLEAREGEHLPKSEEYGIFSFTIRAPVPFHPARLAEAADEMCARTGALGVLVRAKGVAWLASRHARQATLALAGRRFSMEPGPPWWDAIDREAWPEGLAGDLKPLWRELHGDQQSEVVVIGVLMDRAAVEARLRCTLLTEAEMATGPEAWAAELPDPFADARDAAETVEAATAAEHALEHAEEAHEH
ncbi:cobalamin synthesis protein cobW C-terminal domain-containing protein [Pavlovales sp. CCMP2436]|nr:cobalamin synthesis protein cobW C-terminal domain-containing protein [Pavlovales sp. CCMP2436]